MLVAMLIIIIVCLVAYIVGQIIRACRVKNGCVCGAASGRWFKLWDAPITLGSELTRPKSRRWTREDFVQFSSLSGGRKL
jgi:hypothetical protein